MPRKKFATLEVSGLSKSYKEGKTLTPALVEASFRIFPGTLNILIGPSGAGKTTLLNILGGMDNADAGSVEVDGKQIIGLSEKELSAYRRDKVGFVFQSYNLMPNLTALENVGLATDLKEDSTDPSLALEMVGLSHRKKNLPKHLSGGEQQRVCIARAIAKNPAILLCDEPTGALDYETGKEILGLLEEMAHTQGKTILIATHNSALARFGDHLLEIKDGRIVKDQQNGKPRKLKDIVW